MHALATFHTKHPNLALAINVTRHPYSFIGDSKSPEGSSLSGYAGKSQVPTTTWHESLLGYTGSEEARQKAESGMYQLGLAAEITFDYNVLTQWQPIESQRLLLWAGQYGLQEEFMTNLNRRHFENKESASLRSTLLNSAEEVGLDRVLANAFLDTNQYEQDVWDSYGNTIREKGIHSIPMFVYNVPALNVRGGPFREPDQRDPWVVRGSMDEDYFLHLFEKIASQILKAKGWEENSDVKDHQDVARDVKGGKSCEPTLKDGDGKGMCGGN